MMKRITTTIARKTATAGLRGSWGKSAPDERLGARGERIGRRENVLGSRALELRG